MSKLKLFFTILFLFCGLISAPAQENFDDGDQPPAPQTKRPKLLRELNLTPDQIREIRELNQSVRQDLRAAQIRQAEVRRALDQAIYAENPDETLVEQRIREFQQAQAEVARIRAQTEFAIRKILTPEQLVRFNELRQEFGERRRTRRAVRNPLRPRANRRPERRVRRQP